MLNSRVFAVPVLVMALVATTPFQNQGKASASSNLGTIRSSYTAQNKFVGRWSSQIKFSNGEIFDDGVLDISDTTQPSDGEVSVLHSVRGGPVIGHTMSYPQRIEIQISLGDGRVAHYNGVLTSATRIEGRYFETGKPQSNHAGARVIVLEEGTWSAGAT